MGFPEPSKIRPSMSSDTPSFKLCPVNSTLVCDCQNVSPSAAPVQVPSSRQCPKCLRRPGSILEGLSQTTGIVRCTWTTARFPSACISGCISSQNPEQLTSSFQDLSRALSAIRQSEGHDLVVSREFNLRTPSAPALFPFQAPSATHIVEDNQWTVDAADGVVPYPRRHRDHAGIHDFRHRGGVERFGEV
jgi:hypothetical protein